ncbi:MAG: hypothetical protein Q8P41_00655 [Pseudomonadota bacterium]|nr:hypothetical protein [Pseudomonadota bacterium]
MADALAAPPGKVQAIGVMHLIGGIFNLIIAAMWVLAGLSWGVATLGIGFVMCCPVLLYLPVGILEIVSGVRHLSSDHSGLQPPKGIAIVEICMILTCSTFSMIFGILTLVFLSDPEVTAYYESKRLTG